ncbi:MAG: response regulator [Acidobacteria bacterium]|nr:response regulator [Acidobacteriota bacterium]
MTSFRGTVLVVEDAGSCATTLEIALARIPGLAVRVVSSAEEARLVLDQGGVCALVTDVHLPRASGLDLIGWVRARESLARLPIVVISGDSDPQTPAASLRLGADAYFTKPFSPSEVRQKLEDLIYAKPGTPAVP